jgi:type I restriction enzyme S subunit
MKAAWVMRPLGDLCKTGAGGTPLKSVKEYYEGGDVPWLISGEVSQGEITESTNFITRKGLENSSARLFPPNTVLIAMYGATAGQVGILRFEASTNQAVCGILPSEIFLPEFLFYYFLHKKEELIAQAAGNAQPNISQVKIKKIGVPLVPIPEQHRIVAILAEAFEGIATAKAIAERNLQNARELFASFLGQTLSGEDKSWPARALRDLCVVDWGNTNLTKSAYVEDGEFLAVSAAGCDGRIGHREHKAYTPVMSAIGAQCGRMFLPTEDFTAIKNTITLTPREGVCSGPFLYRLFTAVELPKRGAAQPFIAKGDIQVFTVRVPDSLKQQDDIVEAIAKFEAETEGLEALVQRKLAALNELKKSLLHEAFSGAL